MNSMYNLSLQSINNYLLISNNPALIEFNEDKYQKILEKQKKNSISNQTYTLVHGIDDTITDYLDLSQGTAVTETLSDFVEYQENRFEVNKLLANAAARYSNISDITDTDVASISIDTDYESIYEKGSKTSNLMFTQTKDGSSSFGTQMEYELDNQFDRDDWYQEDNSESTTTISDVTSFLSQILSEVRPGLSLYP